MPLPKNFENSLLSGPNRPERVTIGDLAKCVAVGLLAVVTWSFMSFDEAHASVDGSQPTGSATLKNSSTDCEVPEQPPARERLEKVQDSRNLKHKMLPLLDRLQVERNLRQAMYDEEGTRETLLDNTMRSALVIKPEHAQIRTTISPRLLREIINAYHREAIVAVHDSAHLSRTERKFAYKLKTRFGIDIARQNDTESQPVNATLGLTLRDALVDLEVLQEMRDIRVGVRNDSFSKTTTQQVLHNEPAIFSVRYKVVRKKKTKKKTKKPRKTPQPKPCP